MEMKHGLSRRQFAVLPTLIIFFFAQRYFVQGIVVSGVKG